jgi:hypothetical protein
VDSPPEWPVNTMVTFQSALAPIVNSIVTSPSDDPLLAPPLYGRWHAGLDKARPQPEGVTWFDEMNLDPRHRAVAAFGTRVVQEHQEALMASAWQQAGDVQAANQRLRQLQLSVKVGISLHVRHFESMETPSLMRVASPALTRARSADTSDNSVGATLATMFVRSALPVKSMSPPMRKLSRARGPVHRRLSNAARITAPLRGFVARVNDAAAIFVTPPAPLMATFNAVRLQSSALSAVLTYPQVTKETIDETPGAPQFQITAEGVRIRMPVEGTDVPLQDNAVASAFRGAAKAHLEKLNPGRPWISVFPQPRRLNLEEIRVQLSAQMSPEFSIAALAEVMVPGRTIAAESVSPATSVSTVMYAPHFPQPMYETLRDLSQELMLPGLETVTPNSVIGLRTNQRFVNAYMVGLNFEMARELLWRGYPTDQRGTYFDQFWDTAGSEPPRQLDVDPPLHEWGARPLSGPPVSAQGKFVMLLRSELLRRYPTAAIYAAPALMRDGKRVPDPTPENEQHPVFRGTLPPDVTFVGFNLSARQVVGGPVSGAGYFIVIQEQPTEPRFGIDADFVTLGSSYLNTADGPPAGLPLQGLQWRQNSAHMAGIIRRLPVRIAIHASQFVAPDDLPPET